MTPLSATPQRDVNTNSPIRFVRHVWDTVISIEAGQDPVLPSGCFSLPDSRDSKTSLELRIDSLIAHVTSLCSLHEESELTEFNRGERTFEQLDPDLHELIRLANHARGVSKGRYDHERSGLTDLYGLAKGWAAERIACLLEQEGFTRVGVNVGGDIFVTSAGTPWEIGLQHPFEPDSIFHTVKLSRGAVATSGTYERGIHLHGEPINVSSTVIGPSGALADAYATAGCYDEPGSARWLPDEYHQVIVGSRKVFYTDTPLSDLL